MTRQADPDGNPPAVRLCAKVEAPDETAAEAVAVSLFDLEQRKRPVLGGKPS